MQKAGRTSRIRAGSQWGRVQTGRGGEGRGAAGGGAAGADPEEGTGGRGQAERLGRGHRQSERKGRATRGAMLKDQPEAGGINARNGRTVALWCLLRDL